MAMTEPPREWSAERETAPARRLPGLCNASVTRLPRASLASRSRLYRRHACRPPLSAAVVLDERNDACFIVRDKTGRRWRTSVYAIAPPKQLKPSWGRQAPITAVQLAAKRRDDIAHGVVEGYTIDGVHIGAFLMPPEYNTGRTTAFITDLQDPLSFKRAKYRYTADDIKEITSKFRELERAIWDLFVLMRKDTDGRIMLVKAVETEEAEKRRSQVDPASFSS